MSHDKYYADIGALAEWADSIIAAREPDFVVGLNYLRRWWVIPRNHFQNTYLHEINQSDDARALHDHPWDNISMLLRGSYDEYTPNAIYRRSPGDVIHRKATDSHRLELVDNQQVISLFTTGPIIREWGFHCPRGWVRWQDFVDITGNQSLIGRGCGEYA